MPVARLPRREDSARTACHSPLDGLGYLSSRNEFIDQLEEGFTPRRDLVSEIAQQLHSRGKRLIIYLPGAHTPADPTVKRLLGRGTEGYADRHTFIRDYSLKLGEACAGWWFDSCSPQAESVWIAEMDACRAGNPQSVVAFSGAEFCASGGQIRPVCPIADYHGGEIHLIEDGRIRTDLLWPPGEGIVISADGKLRKTEQPATFYMPDAQFIDNVQLHCLLPIDSTFNPAVPVQFCRYSDRELFQFVDGVKAVGGAVTLNVCHDPEPSDFGDIREIEDRIIDWDRYDRRRNVPMVPQRSRQAVLV